MKEKTALFYVTCTEDRQSRTDQVLKLMRHKTKVYRALDLVDKYVDKYGYPGEDEKSDYDKIHRALRTLMQNGKIKRIGPGLYRRIK